jgi:hypothetical protein
MRGCLELFREEEEERLGFWPQPSMKLRQDVSSDSIR